MKAKKNDAILFFETIRQIPSIETQLVFWINAHKNNHPGVRLNESLKYDDTDVYVRKVNSEIEGTFSCVLEIANINVNPKKRGKLWFTYFLQIVHSLNPWDYTAVDCVNNPRLAEFLKKIGWNRIDGIYRNCPSFYKKKQIWLKGLFPK